jgi:uncharacterized phiE125 gp8 family phage protein
MGLVQLSGPGAEPLSLEEIKSYLRVDGNAEDVLVQSLVLTSRLHIEAALGLALMTQSWKFVLDAWPVDGVVDLPIAPVQQVSDVRVIGKDGTALSLDADGYELDTSSRPPRLYRKSDTWPTPGRAHAGIEIDITAGFGASADAVPAPIRQALMLLVAHWYEHRDPIEIGTPSTAVPNAVSRLLHPYRVVRL